MQSESTFSATPSDGSATQKVLAVTELLENILLQLSMTDIFQAQSVSKHFRDLMSDSHSLQRKLFLLPDKQPEAAIIDRKARVRINPLIDDCTFRVRIPLYTTDTSRVYRAKEGTTIVSHSHATGAKHLYLAQSVHSSLSSNANSNVQLHFAVDWNSNRVLNVIPPGSSMRMYLSQPLCESISVFMGRRRCEVKGDMTFEKLFQHLASL